MDVKIKTHPEKVQKFHPLFTLFGTAWTRPARCITQMKSIGADTTAL
jgi:hypothetical protein